MTMPLKRTPPSPARDQPQLRTTRAAQKLKCKAVQQQIEAEAASLSTDDHEQLQRPSRASSVESLKRKFDGVDDGDMRSAVAEMRILFSNLTSSNAEKFDTLNNSIVSFDVRVSEMAKSIEFLTSKHELLLENYAQLMKEKEEDRKYMRELEEQIEILQRKSRNSSIELRNVPQSIKFETKQQLNDILTSIGSTTGAIVQENDIRDIYRVHTRKEDTKPIIVEFSSTWKKEKVLSMIKRFNKGKKKEDKLHTKHIKIDGPARPIYVSECLTPRAKILFYQARDFAKTHSYSFCWTANGIIYLRQRDNSPHIRINTEEDLKKLSIAK